MVLVMLEASRSAEHRIERVRKKIKGSLRLGQGGDGRLPPLVSKSVRTCGTGAGRQGGSVTVTRARGWWLWRSGGEGDTFTRYEPRHLHQVVNSSTQWLIHERNV